MTRAKKVFEWCLKQGRGKGEHRGLRRIKPSLAETKKHVKKALHNLRAVDHNIKGGFPDWAVSAAFYAKYHSLLAILYKMGYESRNQECTISAVEHFIKTKKIVLDLKYIEMIRRTSEMMPKDSKALREEFQYGTEVSVNEEVLDRLKKNAIEFVETVQILLESLETQK